ncbi:MAG: Gfo/Idh/MocA family protein [Tropicimonas sp.]|uniref:Gfo/Idh/MocA family protein n=1 Tax=Tropicimonas sp. TaxID=2067044 RepID=UPI003A893BBD
MSRLKRIGVVGGGIYGTQMLKCFAGQQRLGRVELAAVADLDTEVLGRHAERYGTEGYTDYTVMLTEARLDAVAVATPDHLHAPVIREAVKHGLHIISQKPLDVDSTRSRELVDLCDAAGLLLYVDFHKRFDPGHIRLRNEIAAGDLGRLQYASVQMEDRIEVPTEWLRSWAARSSPSWFLGVHFYDLVHFLTGLEPVRVLASGYKGKLESMGLAGAWDSIQAKVEYEGGFSVNYDLSWILPKSFPTIVNQGIHIVGEEGMAEVDSQDRGYLSAYSRHAASVVANPFSSLEYEHPIFGTATEGYTFTSMSYFIDILNALDSGHSLASLKGSYPDGHAALVSTRIGEAVARSILSGQIEPV